MLLDKRNKHQRQYCRVLAFFCTWQYPLFIVITILLSFAVSSVAELNRRLPWDEQKHDELIKTGVLVKGCVNKEMYWVAEVWWEIKNSTEVLF